MVLHLGKKGIRVMGVAESFRGSDVRSVLCAVVMRADRIIDGVAFGAAKLEGYDATKQIYQIFKRLHRNDINLIILSGCIISLYNIVDVYELAKKTHLPVICLTYKESAGIEDALRSHFGVRAGRRLQLYRRLGGRSELKLKSGYRVFVRLAGLAEKRAEEVLNTFTLQGAIPEPIRVAKLIARSRLRSADP
jgi:endonuclease V-like protein UPF0215 family